METVSNKRDFFPGVKYVSHYATHLMAWTIISAKLGTYILNNSWTNIAVSCVTGMIFTDIFSALSHWASEAFRTKKDYRYRSKYVIQEHHTDVLNYSLMTYGERISIGYYFLIIYLIFNYMTNIIEGPVTFMMLWSCFIFISHTWSHEVASGITNNKLIILLQRLGILLPATIHSRHHFWDTTRWFGFLNGISDYITNPIFVYLLPNYETFDNERQVLVFNLIRARKQAFQKTGSIFVPEIDNCLSGQLHQYCQKLE